MVYLLTFTRWEWFRLRKRAGALALFSLAALLALAVLGFAVVLNRSEFFFSEAIGYFPVAAGTLSVIAPLLAIILAAFVHGMDLQGGSVRTLVARGNPRLVVLGSKALACALVLLAFHLLVALAAALLSVVPTVNLLDWRDGLTGMGASLLNSFLYLSLGMALAHWRQSVAFTIGAGIALIFAEALFYPLAEELAGLLDWPVRDFTAWTLSGVSSGLRGGSFLFGAVWYIPIVLAYTLVLAGLAALCFEKFDLKGGE